MYNQIIMEKVSLARNGNEITLHIPFQKIDVENRRVFGFATIDSIDKHGEVVTAEASATAFTNFTGGLREMHAPIAVGKVVSFQQEDIYDQGTDSIYNGIFVETYVSKGAQDTWEKVLDGTLKGFSIGGEIRDYVDQYNADDDAFTRYITGYELHELSLVDNPANPLCSVISIQKNADGITGISVGVNVDNVFWCTTDSVAITKKADAQNCRVCGDAMENIGWVEDNSLAKMKDLVRAKKLEKSETEGGTTDMADTATEANKETPDAGTTEIAGDGENAVVTTEQVTEAKEEDAEKVEKAEEPTEEPTSEVTNELDLVKIADSLTNVETLLKGFETREAERTAELGAIKKSVETVEATLTEKHTALAKQFEDFQASVAAVEKRVDGVESSTAVKKSIDSGTEPPVKEKRSVFSGAFLPGNAE